MEIGEGEDRAVEDVQGPLSAQVFLACDEILSRSAGRGYLIRRNRLLTLFGSKASGSKLPPTHLSMAWWSSCVGSRRASRKLSYPGTPPQSSGGHARAPARQTGMSADLSSGVRIFSTTTRCSQPSPKSYS